MGIGFILFIFIRFHLWQVDDGEHGCEDTKSEKGTVWGCLELLLMSGRSHKVRLV